MRTVPLKMALTVLLLGFVAVSVAYALIKELRPAPAQAGNAPQAATPAQAAQEPGAAGLEILKAGKPLPAGTKFRAVYYHGNTRCPTCIKIESYSTECFKQRFAKEIKSGKLAFSIVNYDEKGNEHFYKDYNLVAQSLIVSAVKDGKELKYQNLEKVWDLTYDKVKFMDYVESATREFMSGGEQATGTQQASAAGAAPEGSPATEGKHTLVAYYFHGDARCPSCLKIEAYTAAAIKENFAGQMADGSLSWKVVNIDQPENRHYVGDYQLKTKSVVLSDRYGGQERTWKNLERVWELLSDEPAFKDYIASEVGAALGPQ